VRQIRAAHLDELVRVPLLATIAAIIFEQQHDRPLPDNQYQLYEPTWDSCVPRVPTTRTCSNGWARPCWNIWASSAGNRRLAADRRTRLGHRPSCPERLQSAWLDELTSFLTAVGPWSSAPVDLQFLHHTFAEHLAATAAASVWSPVRSTGPDFRPCCTRRGRTSAAGTPVGAGALHPPAPGRGGQPRALAAQRHQVTNS